jgi:hypothetical protein
MPNQIAFGSLVPRHMIMTMGRILIELLGFSKMFVSRTKARKDS